AQRHRAATEPPDRREPTRGQRAVRRPGTPRAWNPDPAGGLHGRPGGTAPRGRGRAQDGALSPRPPGAVYFTRTLRTPSRRTVSRYRCASTRELSLAWPKVRGSNEAFMRRRWLPK